MIKLIIFLLSVYGLWWSYGNFHEAVDVGGWGVITTGVFFFLVLAGVVTQLRESTEDH